MKTLLLSTFLLSTSAFASYGKPKLIARYGGVDAFKAPEGMYCFASEPQPSKEGVFLGCQDSQGYLMMKWQDKFEVISRSENGNFSHPKDVAGKISWYEFSEAGVQKIFEYKDSNLKEIRLKDLGGSFALVDSFTAVKEGAYVYRLQEDATKNLNLWSDHRVSHLSLTDVAYIFPPTSSVDGEVLAKIRKDVIDENSPDELVMWDGEYRTLLKDRDADETSSVKSFRHQYAFDKGIAALVVSDDEGEAMALVSQGKMRIIARAGKDLKSFDYFSPKLRNGVLAFRGVDLKNRKTVFIYTASGLETLITEGGVIQTDKGPARAYYKNQDAIFYGAPGIAENGDIYQQITLTDIDSPMTLLGIGLIHFKKE